MMPKRKSQRRVALYLRVSTAEQTVANQRRELTAVPKRHGWKIVATFADEGISGAKGRDKRPGFDGFMKAITRREIDMVAAWSVDRLGRSLQDLIGFLGEVHGSGVDHLQLPAYFNAHVFSTDGWSSNRNPNFRAAA